MKKVFKIVLIAFALVLMLGVYASAERFVTVKLDGEVLEFDVQARIINGRTMVPLRKIFETLGAEVFWDKETYTAIGIKDTRSVEAQINNPVFYVNGEEKLFDTPAMLVDGRTLIPLRFVAESFGAVVDWEDETSTAIIISPEKIKLEDIVTVPYRYDLSEYVSIAREDYMGLEYPSFTVEATDEEVTAQLMLLANEYAEYTMTDAPCKNGDLVNIDYEGFLNGQPLENGADSGSEFVLGEGGFIDGFESAIVGHCAGEEFSFDVVFPEDYGYEELQGATVTFKIKLNLVKEIHLPELNDEFIAAATEFDTFLDCFNYFKKAMSKQMTENARAEVANAVFEGILKKASVKKLPEAEYNQKRELTVANYEAMAAQYGITLDVLVQISGMTMEDFEALVHDETCEALLTELVVYSIANSEDIVSRINKADYIDAVDRIAASNSVTYDDVIRLVPSDTIVTYVILEAVIDFVFENGVAVGLAQ